LIAAARPRYRAVIAAAVFTGLRQGELLGLRWMDIDFEAGLVHVRGQLDRSKRRVAGAKVSGCTVKTRPRSVPTRATAGAAPTRVLRQ
jgi:integrase